MNANNRVRSVEPTRDPMGITVASVMLLVAVGIAYLALAGGGAWLLLLIPVFVLVLIGAAGLAQDLPKRPRDANGNPIEKDF